MGALYTAQLAQPKGRRYLYFNYTGLILLGPIHASVYGVTRVHFILNQHIQQIVNTYR